MFEVKLYKMLGATNFLVKNISNSVTKRKAVVTDVNNNKNAQKNANPNSITFTLKLDTI